ncbi:MAG: YidC/Oxa1 family membrane protein insertase [Longimicrobiales bacterium]
MNPWTAAVDALAAALTWVGGALGVGLVLGIPVFTFVVRSALIPILAPLAVRTRDRMRVVRRIRPQIKELDRKFRDDPNTLEARLKALHAENGIGMVDWPGLGAALLQVPLLIALFQAVLEVWPADALTAGGAGLGLVASALSMVGTKTSGQAEGAAWMLWMSGLLPIAICLWLGTGVGLYLSGFYAAGALQGLVMRRGAK